eukprot:TRINITY_DN4507_c0_g1_i1.p1 TRINITY_DN4507_c0_g1~~TRINITY_DN4507_c0_g1_i1.p1  ORF type:complete len:836 (-),score=194.41 TRINITY_DN4507_c0_g1_i1:209-2716(-)
MKKLRSSAKAQKNSGNHAAGAAAEGPSLFQRLAVAVLVAANVATCVATFYCMRLVLHRDAGIHQYEAPDVDLSALYDEPGGEASLHAVKQQQQQQPPQQQHQLPVPASPAAPVLKMPPPPSPPAAQAFPPPPPPPPPSGPPPPPPPAEAVIQQQPSPASGRNFLERQKENYDKYNSERLEREKSKLAHLPQQAGQPQSQATQFSVPTEGLHPIPLPWTGGVPLRRGRSSQHACKPCSAKVRGPLPTTLHEELAGPRTDCNWLVLPNQYIGGFASTVESALSLERALILCLELESHCTGVTCDKGPTVGQRCTVRSGTEHAVSPSGETSYMKECPAPLDCSTVEVIQTVPPPPPGGRPAVVILAHNRREYLDQCLDSLLKQPERKLYDIHVSLDDLDSLEPMRQVIQSAAIRGGGANVSSWEVPVRRPDPAIHNDQMIAWFKTATGKIAHHYWVALERAFMEHNYEEVIFVEEDLIFSPDFFAFFRSTSHLLAQDPTLWCVSAWNDFGFEHTAFDQCRLRRTSYFPGLGFMMRRDTWKVVREQWPEAPTMGWDYWMRVAFKRAKKECVIPEVSRSHHISKTGSSITKDSQVKLLAAMALASSPSTCSMKLNEPCEHFGDVSYLISDTYDGWLADAAKKAQVIPLQHDAKTLHPGSLYIMPYVRHQYREAFTRMGVMPKGTKNAIPADVRTDHYGALVTKNLESRATVLMLDKRSPLDTLPEGSRIRLSKSTLVQTSKQGQSCNEACRELGPGHKCDVEQMEFMNDCNILKEHFGCEAGCAHQVGKELPCYVSDDKQPTWRQCLVTFISVMNCESKHKSTRRLCSCSQPGGGPGGGR